MHHINSIHTFLSMPSLLLCLIHTLGVQRQFKTEKLALTKSVNVGKISMVHWRKISLAESWGSSRFFISIFFILIIFKTSDLELSYLDGANGESVRAKIHRCVKLVEVNKI